MSTLLIRLLSYFYLFYTNIRELSTRHPLALLYVVAITVYGIWCFLSYFDLPGAGRTGGSRGMPLFIVPIIAVWFSWRGSFDIISTGRDFDRSLGYLKMAGGTALIVITNIFIVLMRG